MDLTNPVRLQTWEELDHYVYGVACCVGQAVLSILGADTSLADAYSLAMGSMLQYLNILRDLKEDLASDRVYVPEEFLLGRNLLSCASEARAELYQRAMKFRSEAVPYSWKCFPAEMMASIYATGATRYWLKDSPQRLSTWEKIRALGSALWFTTKILSKKF
jgi:hypothetical protein